MTSCWGVGRVMVAGEAVPWAVSAADVDDEADAMAGLLSTMGVGRGDVVLVVALLSMAVHAVPLERAAGRLGALYSSADATAPDAFRTAALIGWLHPAAVIGVNGAVVEGLRDAGRDVGDVFGPVDAVATADEEAHAALAAAGLAPRRWLRLGPTSAVECGARDGLHYDGDRWLLDGHNGVIAISNLVPRLTPARRLPTGAAGSVVTEPCPCGHPGPRLRLSTRAAPVPTTTS